MSEPLDDRDDTSKSAAEIRAAIEAIKIAKAWGIGRMAIHTESKYLRNVNENLIFYWMDNGWRKTTQRPRNIRRWIVSRKAIGP